MGHVQPLLLLLLLASSSVTRAAGQQQGPEVRFRAKEEATDGRRVEQHKPHVADSWKSRLDDISRSLEEIVRQVNASVDATLLERDPCGQDGSGSTPVGRIRILCEKYRALLARLSSTSEKVDETRELVRHLPSENASAVVKGPEAELHHHRTGLSSLRRMHSPAVQQDQKLEHSDDEQSSQRGTSRPAEGSQNTSGAAGPVATGGFGESAIDTLRFAGQLEGQLNTAEEKTTADDQQLQYDALEELLYKSADPEAVSEAVAGLVQMAQPLQHKALSAPKFRKRCSWRCIHRLPSSGWIQPSVPPPGPPPGQPGAAGSGSDPAAVEENSMLVAGGGFQVDEAVASGLVVPAKALVTVASLAAWGLVQLPSQLPRDWHLQGLHAAALAGSPAAHLALADRYFHGRGVRESCATAYHHARAAADVLYAAGESEGEDSSPASEPLDLRERWRNAQYRSERELVDSEQQIAWERVLAGRGRVEVQNYLGYRQLIGRGVDADPAAALQLFQDAAAQGDPSAIYNIACMMLKGEHVEQNATRAMEMFQQASAAGLAAAHNAIGIMHSQGLGVPANLSRAAEFYRNGTHLGNADSAFNLAAQLAAGLGVEKNETEAVRLMEQAMAQKHWRAPYHLAMYTFEGAGTGAPSCPAAAALLRRFLRMRAAWGAQLEAAEKALEAGAVWRSLVQYTLLAEQGCDVAAANAAWLLRHRAAAGRSEATATAAAALRLLLQAAAKNNTGGMVDAAAQLYPAPAAGELLRAAAALNSSEAATLLAWAALWGTAGEPTNATRARELSLDAVRRSWGTPHALPALLLLAGLRATGLLPSPPAVDAEAVAVALLAVVLAAVLCRRQQRRRAAALRGQTVSTA